MISPNPGPTLEIADADAEIQVKKSRPLNDKRRAEDANVMIYKKKNVITDSYVDSETFLPLNWADKTI